MSKASIVGWYSPVSIIVIPINRVTNNKEDRNANTLKLLSQYMCMKNAHTRKAFIVAMTMASGNANAGGIPKPVPKADVATVRIVKPINPKKTPNKSFVETGWQNAGRSS